MKTGYLIIGIFGFALAVSPVHEAPGGSAGERKPAEPQIQEKPFTEDKEVKQWKPGDPVRVMEDLREDGGRKGECGQKDRTIGPAAVHKPVAPQEMEKNLKDLPRKKGYQPGEPVRVMPDLRENGEKKTP